MANYPFYIFGLVVLAYALIRWRQQQFYAQQLISLISHQFKLGADGDFVSPVTLIPINFQTELLAFSARIKLSNPHTHIPILVRSSNDGTNWTIWKTLQIIPKHTIHSKIINLETHSHRLSSQTNFIQFKTNYSGEFSIHAQFIGLAPQPKPKHTFIYILHKSTS